MTVKELIEVLQRLPAEAPVIIGHQITAADPVVGFGFNGTTVTVLTEFEDEGWGA